MSVFIDQRLHSAGRLDGDELTVSLGAGGPARHVTLRWGYAQEPIDAADSRSLAYRVHAAAGAGAHVLGAARHGHEPANDADAADAPSTRGRDAYASVGSADSGTNRDRAGRTKAAANPSTRFLRLCPPSRIRHGDLERGQERLRRGRLASTYRRCARTQHLTLQRAAAMPTSVWRRSAPGSRYVDPDSRPRAFAQRVAIRVIRGPPPRCRWNLRRCTHPQHAAPRSELVLLIAVFLLVFSYFRHGLSFVRMFVPELAAGLLLIAMWLEAPAGAIGAAGMASMVLLRVAWLMRSLHQRPANADDRFRCLQSPLHQNPSNS